jgi:hypothetical protein
MLFNTDDFDPFVKLLHSLNTADFKYKLGNNQKVILKTNSSTVGLSLTKSESQELAQLMIEAQLIFEVNNLIGTYNQN